MRAPATFEGTATVRDYKGGMAALVKRLDPQRWSSAFPYIWTDCYFTKPTYFVEPTAAGANDGDVRKGEPKPNGDKGDDAVSPPPLQEAPPPRSLDPARLNEPSNQMNQGARAGAHAQGQDPISPPPEGTNLFYEEALFGDYQYRNILKVTFTTYPGGDPQDEPSGKRRAPAAKKAGRKPGKGDRASYEYSQHACLNAARDPLRVDGGIDVDSGFAAVEALDGTETRIKVTINKQVRFTKPALLVDELNDLAHVFVPLSLDSWLHTLIFTDEEEQDAQGA
jgi:hypothetical protein